jgi:heme-degrading monooxygenase HmoA
MAYVGQPYTSGHWRVKQGSEDEFVEAWTAFTKWAKDSSPGAESFVLIRSTNDPQRFVSFGAWKSIDEVNKWRSTPEFAEHMGRCRSFCDDFAPDDSTVAANVG